MCGFRHTPLLLDHLFVSNNIELVEQVEIFNKFFFNEMNSSQI